MDMTRKGEPISPEESEKARRQDRARICRALIEERRLVQAAFGQKLCANFNWDMLLELYEAESEGRDVYQSALCLSAGIPDSSAHRWAAKLAARGVFARRHDDMDKRRIIVTMTDDTRHALDRIMDGLARWAP